MALKESQSPFSSGEVFHMSTLMSLLQNVLAWTSQSPFSSGEVFHDHLLLTGIGDDASVPTTFSSQSPFSSGEVFHATYPPQHGCT